MISSIQILAFLLILVTLAAAADLYKVLDGEFHAYIYASGAHHS